MPDANEGKLNEGKQLLQTNTDLFSEFCLAHVTNNFMKQIKKSGMESICKCSTNLKTKQILDAHKTSVAISTTSFYVSITLLFDQIKNYYAEQQLEQKKQIFYRLITMENIVIPCIVLRTKRRINLFRRNLQILN